MNKLKDSKEWKPENNFLSSINGVKSKNSVSKYLLSIQTTLLKMDNLGLSEKYKSYKLCFLQ